LSFVVTVNENNPACILQDQKGLISKKDLYETCCQFDIPLNNEQLTQLFDYCDPNRNGVIDYVEFANFLNWKNPMHTGFPKRKHVV